MIRCLITGLPALALLAVTQAASAQQVTFKKIAGTASANDMSPDGRFIVGEADIDGNGFADGTYRLDMLLDEMLILPPEGNSAAAVSDDGRVVLGSIPDPDDASSEVAGMWTAETGWMSLGYLPDALACPSRSNGYELSADGSVAVGLSWDGCSGRGFVWTQETGMLELEPLANGGNRASVVSADGAVIGGFAQGTFSRTPASWDGITTAGQLLDPPNGDVLGEVHGVSDDGTVLLAVWDGDAVRWTASGDVQVIGAGSLLPAWSGIPMDIADDGTIVGFDFLIGNRRAWLQPGGTGPLVLLTTYITEHGGTVPPAAGVPQVCQAISRDGRRIIGHTGFYGAWMVNIHYPRVPSIHKAAP